MILIYISDQELVSAALAMRKLAYSPYSHFAVGAALESEDGTVYTGCNVENASYGCSICAERAALVKAVSDGKRHFRRIAIAGSSEEHCWPCGICRQMLSEFSPKLETLVSDQLGNYVKTDLNALIPHSFRSENLGLTD